MFDHLFDIDGKAIVPFERFDFAAKEMRLNGNVIWTNAHGLAPEGEEFEV